MITPAKKYVMALEANAKVNPQSIAKTTARIDPTTDMTSFTPHIQAILPKTV